MKYKWLVKESQEITKEFLEIAYGCEIIGKLLLNRNINSSKKAKAYLNPNFYTESRSEEIPDLVKAKDRIIEAINKKENITIFGDYDVDGVTSTACLLTTLRQFTNNVDFYIPNRLTEGYGLNIGAVKTLAKKHKTKLLITCDCGITNHKEIELANELKMDVVVTDHHSLPEILPPAHAILNPKLLPGDHKLHWLPGVGVAYKLAEEILNSKNILLVTEQKISKDDLLDLVALGMIADLAPLVDENRYLVQIGLEKLANTRKVGLQELLRICGCAKQDKNAPNVEHIGFGIAPRINAVGRLTDAALAVRLLTTDNLLEAIQIACELEAQNRERQFLCESTLNEAITLVSEKIDLSRDKCIVLANDKWHHGVIGIVASRIVEKFSLPTILIAVDKEQNIARGSGRSIEKLNIIDALVKSSKHLEKYGGHKAACGLSIKPEFINNFILDFTQTVNYTLRDSELSPILNIDLELPLSSLSIDLLDKIYKLSPFGLGNPMPLFASKEIEIINIKNIGKNNQHLKLVLKETVSQKTFEGLIWNFDNKTIFRIGDKVNIAYTPKLNNYGGEVFIQLEIKDFELIEKSFLMSGKENNQKKKNLSIEIYDFRGKTKECLSLLSNIKSVVYFAEVGQKDYLPLKTHSRYKIPKTETLVFLDTPPDEIILLQIVKSSEASKVYFAFNDDCSHINEQTIKESENPKLKQIGNSYYLSGKSFADDIYGDLPGCLNKQQRTKTAG